MRPSVSFRLALAAIPSVSLIVMVGLALAVLPASAKPKKIVSNGCTAEQIQSPGGSRCVDKMEQDLLNNVAYPHFVMCDETGAYCCQGDSTRTFGCKKISALRGGMSPINRAPGGLTINPGN